MAERYSRVFLLEKNCYSCDCPILVSAGAILKDNQTGKLYAQLKLKNFQKKTIKAVKVQLTCKDTVGRVLGEPAEKSYYDLSAARDAEFGTKDLILLENPAARAFSVVVEEVCFADNTVWTGDGSMATALPEPAARAPFGDIELEKQFKLEYGEDFKSEPTEIEDLWYCACGSLNRAEEPSCHHCSRCLSDIKTIDIEALSTRKDARIAEEKAEAARRAEEARIAAEEQARAAAERAKKNRKMAAILATAAAICLAGFLMATKVIIPNSNYNAAVALKNAGQYEDAISAFEAMEGYKDSAEQIHNCNTALKDIAYDEATAMKNAGQYEEAILAFKAMDGYKDSTEQIRDCEIAQKEIAYDAAVSLMNAGQYEAAISAFQKISPFRDCTDLISACSTDLKYSEALTYMNAKRYSVACEDFRAIMGYKDSAERFAACCKEMFSKAKVGDSFTFGAYKQSNGSSNRARAIEWIVLEKQENKLLVVSRYALDNQPYNNNPGTDVTWETCTLRKWLNETFMETAFTAEEQRYIASTKVYPDKNPEWKSNLGKVTVDKVFLLSMTEAEKYYNSNDARKCAPTGYAAELGVAFSHDDRVDGRGCCWWWLRTPAKYSNNRVMVVTAQGKMDTDVRAEAVGYGSYGVRPAMWISY